MYLTPNWPAPSKVNAVVTTRAAGNLADYVGDDPQRVAANRQRLQADLKLPNQPVWLTQVHGAQTGRMASLIWLK